MGRIFQASSNLTRSFNLQNDSVEHQHISARSKVECYSRELGGKKRTCKAVVAENRPKENRIFLRREQRRGHIDISQI